MDLNFKVDNHIKEGIPLIVAGIITIVVVVMVVVGIFSTSDKDQPSAIGDEINEGVISTRGEVPAGVVVPGVDGNGVSKDVAVPEMILESSPNLDSESKIRVFSITAKDGAFYPNTVIVNRGDTVRLALKADDQDYDFVQPDFGLRKNLNEGEEGLIIFQASVSGKFTFYCSLCGGIESGAVGYIIIK